MAVVSSKNFAIIIISELQITRYFPIP